MTDLDNSIPEFTVALRGYDRFQVDDYIDKLLELLEDTEERLRSAESGNHNAEVGPRITQIFDLAAAEAQDMRAAAEREAERSLESARGQARALVERNRAEWEGIVGEYEAQRDRIREEVEELKRQKSTVLDEVRKLHDALGAASGLVSADAEPASGSSALVEPQTQLLDAVVDDSVVDDDATREFDTAEMPEDFRQAS